ncbi:hypothetical protein DM813_14540 [Pseudomonas alkylphenolica]|uniref:Uncharacterized protein n=1 Tax=Pseudomonas alkylphenolica TaxID=237609 RepID=A0A443ZSH4_9PSED|nr:hypothetical protein [Pseudomonas alkylphenolica]RWU22391.1 hypothetical protein DM813_14540 [Pseudomonas alkylphenolica]
MDTDKDLEWQRQAKWLPENLLKIMNSEMDTGALTLSQAHVLTVQQYVRYVRSLPSSPNDLIRCLSVSGMLADKASVYSALTGAPGLDPSSLLIFYRQFKEHADSWEVLFATNLRLTSDLIAAASQIARTGSDILEACARTDALGKRRDAWDSLQGGELALLSPADREIISSLPAHVNSIKQYITTYSLQVERVRADASRFCDEARTQLIPVTLSKLKELARHLRPSTKIARLDMPVLSTLHQRTTSQLDHLQTLERLLRETLTASSHFHSAWQSLSSYIDMSNEKLQQITTGQQLARFAIYFGQFLGLWGAIEQSAREMKHKLTQFQG